MKLPLPFTCAKYKTHVRVVDFRPGRLEDFAVRRKVTDFDMLSDDGENSSADEGEDEDEDDSDIGGSQKIWEWRFALRLQDARSTREDDGAGAGADVGCPRQRRRPVPDRFRCLATSGATQNSWRCCDRSCSCCGAT